MGLGVAIGIGLVAVEHLLFLVLEMFLWQRPVGLRIFGQTAEAAKASATLAANQGLYNGFLSAGLVWALLRDDVPTAVFFLSCVAVAGIFGAATVKPRLFLVQGLPAVATLAGLWLSR